MEVASVYHGKQIMEWRRQRMGSKNRQEGRADPPWMVVQLRASRLGRSCFSVQGKLGISGE